MEKFRVESFLNFALRNLLPPTQWIVIRLMRGGNQFPNRNFFDSIMRFIFPRTSKDSVKFKPSFQVVFEVREKMCLNLKTTQRQPLANVIAQNSHQSSVV